MEISQKQASLLILHQHKLLEKAPKQNLLQTIGNICGLQAQAGLPPEIAIWNRIEEYSFGELEKLLYSDKVLAKIWCMRETQHIIPAEDLAMFLQGTRREWLEASAKALVKQGRWTREERLRRIYPLLEKMLSKSPRTRKNVAELLRRAGIPDIELNEEGLAKEACYLGVAIPGPPLADENSSRGPTMTLLKTWLPKTDPTEVSEHEARQILLRRYFASYGPAYLADASYFLGVKISRLSQAFNSIKDELVPVTIKGENGKQWTIKENLKALGKLDDNVEPPVRLLAAYDQIFLGHKDKTRFVPAGHIKQVYLPSANMAHTILISGNVAGVWRWKRKARKVEVTPSLFIEPISMVKVQVHEEAQRLEGFLSSQFR
jgi:uncharacterized protein YcaQ